MNVFIALKGTHFFFYLRYCTLELIHAGDKLNLAWPTICFGTKLLGLTHGLASREWILHWDLLMLVKYITLRLGVAGEKPDTETCSRWWETWHWDLVLLVRNLTLRRAHAGEKPDTETCSRWWETWHWDVLRRAHAGEKPDTETCSRWWEILNCNLLETNKKHCDETKMRALSRNNVNSQRKEND